MSSSATADAPAFKTPGNEATMELTSPNQHPQWIRLALPLAVLTTFLARFAEGRRIDHDVFHALCLWRETLKRGAVPRGDLWAYTETIDPVVHHEWLTGGLNSLLAINLGWDAGGLLAWKAICTLGALTCAATVARLRGVSAAAIATGAIPAMMFSMVSVGTGRAQVTTVFLFSLLLLFLELDQRGQRWWIPCWYLIFPIWLNLHGGVVAGCGVLAIHTLEQTIRLRFTTRSTAIAFKRTRHLWLTGIGLFPLFLLNPYGTKYVTYLIEALSMDRSHINEWWPLYRTMSGFRLNVFAAMIVVALYSIVRRNPRNASGILLLSTLAYLSFGQTRQVCFFALAWLAYVPSWFQSTPLAVQLEQLARNHRKSVAAVACGWALMMLLQLSHLGPPWSPKIPTVPQRGPSYYPTGLVSYLRDNHFHGNLVTSFETGAWISWKMYPEVRISFDSRYEATFPSHVFDDTVDFYGARDGWQAAFKRLGGDAVLMPRSYEIYTTWQDQPVDGWSTVYEDDAQRLIVRNEIADRLPRVDRRGQPLPTDIF